MTHSMWVSLPLFCHWVSWVLSHVMTNSVWVTLIFYFARQSYLISSHDQQTVSDAALFFAQCILSHTNSKWALIIPLLSDWQSTRPTGCQCECHCPFFLLGSLIPWPTACEQQSSLIFLGNLTTFHPMTNRMWVKLPFYLPCSGITSHHDQYVSDGAFFLSWTPCIWSHVQQQVSNYPFFLPYSHHMANSLWVTLPFLMLSYPASWIIWPIVCEWLTLSSVLPCNSLMTLSLPWPTVCEWHCHFCQATSSLSHDQ